MYEITFSDRSKSDIAKHKKSGQKKLLSKIVSFLAECEAHPRSGTGKPERLNMHKAKSGHGKLTNNIASSMR